MIRLPGVRQYTYQRESATRVVPDADLPLAVGNWEYRRIVPPSLNEPTAVI
jgi:predicted nucleotidyltransferase